MRNNLLFRMDSHSTILSILMIVIGLVLILWPGHVMASAMTVLGIALLVGGGITMLYWYRGRNMGADALRLTEGIVMALAGLVVLLVPGLLISLIPTAVGLAVIFNGVLNLAQSLELRRQGYGSWVTSMALAVITIVLGALVLFNPFSTMEMLVVAIGVIILYDGASNLWIESRYRGLFR